MLNTVTKQHSNNTEGASVFSKYRNIEGIEEPILILTASEYKEYMSSGSLPDDHLLIKYDEDKEITSDLVKTWQKFMPGLQLVIVLSKISDGPDIPISSAMKINI